MKPVYLIMLTLSVIMIACGTPGKPKYTPRLPCPDLPLLAENATQAQIAEHDATVVQMYGECRKARRVNPRQDTN